MAVLFLLMGGHFLPLFPRVEVGGAAPPPRYGMPIYKDIKRAIVCVIIPYIHAII